MTGVGSGPDQITRREALRRTALLFGGAISAPTLAGVLGGCGGDRFGAGGRILTGRQLATVGEIAEHIIPETETPGAKAVGVDRFIDEMLAMYYPEEERALFLAGLADVDDRALLAHGRPFLDCTSDEQLELLLELDCESFAPARPAEPPAVDVRERLDGGGSPLPQGGAGRGGWGRGGYQEGLGAELKDTLRDPGPWNMWLGGFGEQLPRYDNHVSLDPERTDKWGIPLLRISAAWSDYEINLLRDASEQAAEMLEAAGCVNIQPFNNPSPPGFCIHEMGTARMGRDPKTSVLNGSNQAHDVPNLFVTDGACMASSAHHNPSLTYMALTARAADYAVEELKRRNL